MGKLKDRLAKFFNLGSAKERDSKHTVRAEAGAALLKPAKTPRKGLSLEPGPETPADLVIAPGLRTSYLDVPHTAGAHEGIATTSSGAQSVATGAPCSAIKLDSRTLVHLSVEQRDQVLEELLRTLESGDPGQKTAAAESLFNTTSEDQISRQKISAMGVVRPLVALLQQSDVKGQMYAAYTLSALTSIETSRDDMRDCNAIAALIAVLISSSNTVSCKGSMRALGRLARTDECALDIVRQGGLRPITALLATDDATLVRRCLIALYFIGADKGDMQREIALAGAIPHILPLCTSPRQEVQAEAADVIKVLARSPECAAIIQRHDGLAVLQAVASDGDHPKARSCAVKALQRLAEVQEYRCSIIQTGGQHLLDVRTETEAEQLAHALFRTDDPAGQAEALKLAVEVGMEDPTAMQHLADAGVVEALLMILQHGDPDVQSHSAWAVGCMAQDADVRKRLCAGGGVPALVYGLTNFDPSGQEGAAACLEKLASLQAAAEQMVREPVVAGLTAVLEAGTHGGQSAAARTLYLLSGVHPSVLTSIAQLPCLPAVARACWHPVPEVQAVALAILKEVARFHPGNAVHLPHGALTALVALEASSIPDLASLASGALSELLRAGEALPGGGAVDPDVRAGYYLAAPASSGSNSGSNSGAAALERRGSAMRRSASGKSGAAGSHANGAARGMTVRAAIAAERGVQAVVTPLIASIARRSGNGATGRQLPAQTGSGAAAAPLSPLAEASMRAVPRHLYFTATDPAHAAANRELSVPLPGNVTLRVEPPDVDALVITRLGLQRGHRFLDIGSGSGYLTALAASIVGPEGVSIGHDVSPDATACALEHAGAFAALQRTPPSAPVDHSTRDCGTLLDIPERFHAIHVGGALPQVWAKALLKLLVPGGKLIATMDGTLRLFEEGRSTTRAPVIGTYCYDAMTPHRRPAAPRTSSRIPPSNTRGRAARVSTGGSLGSTGKPTGLRSAGKASTPGTASPAPRGAAASAPTATAATPRSRRTSQQTAAASQSRNSSASKPLPAAGHNDGAGAAPEATGTSPHSGLAPREDAAALAQPRTVSAKDTTTEELAMVAVQREIEDEQVNGLLVGVADVEICRTADGRRCRLGEGGFGVVYKALMNGVDEVAMKLVKAERPSAKDMELFLKEVRTIAKLHHRNIVQFYGACLDPSTPMFFVTELMKGGDLYSALRHHPDTMRWDKLGKKVALDVALGINYLHTRRPPLLHRDLKSPNVLLSEEGVAKIADVGMVRSQVKDLVTAQPVMTPLWAAPEVMRHERASIKADIWSFGILLWEIITGQDITEFQPLALSRQAGTKNKGKLMVLPPGCPPVVQRIFEACTHHDADRRPTSMDVVAWLRE